MSDARKYHGLCLGGPFDGQVIGSDHDRLRAYLPLPPVAAVPDYSVSVDAAAVVADRVDYQYVRFHFRYTDRPHDMRVHRDFWVPAESTLPELDALDQLIDGYRRPDARAFRNICAVMMNLDLHELERAGVIKPGARGGSDWRRFNMDPLTFVLKLDDERREKLWALIVKRGALRS